MGDHDPIYPGNVVGNDPAEGFPVAEVHVGAIEEEGNLDLNLRKLIQFGNHLQKAVVKSVWF